MRGSIIMVVACAIACASACACDGPKRSAASAPVEQSEEPKLTPASGIAVPRRWPPIRVEPLSLASGHEAYALRGARGNGSLAFLHGMCSHGAGYLQSFERAAADYYRLGVAPTGDLACSVPGQHAWSSKLDEIDARVVEALHAAGADGDRRDVTLIGYSLGASRAEQLARKYPERYRALVLIGAPTQPSPNRLGQLHAAAMLAGERDRQNLMKQGARAFLAAGIRSEFFVLPEASHGQMGPDAERVMREVLEWVKQSRGNDVE